MLGLRALEQALGLGSGPILILAITSGTEAVRTRDTGDTIVIGLPNSLVTICLVRLSSAGLVGVLTGILGISGGVTTDSTAR